MGAFYGKEDISISLTHRLVLYVLEAGECLFCVQVAVIFFLRWIMFKNRKR